MWLSSVGSVSDESMNDGTLKDDYFDAPFKGKRKATDVDFESLSQAEVEELIRKDVDQISGIFGIDVSQRQRTPCIEVQGVSYTMMAKLPERACG